MKRASSKSETALEEANAECIRLNAIAASQLHQIGVALAKKHKYTTHTGVDAIYYYLMQKHHWLPSQARSLSDSDLLFAIAEEPI